METVENCVPRTPASCAQFSKPRRATTAPTLALDEPIAWLSSAAAASTGRCVPVASRFAAEDRAETAPTPHNVPTSEAARVSRKPRAPWDALGRVTVVSARCGRLPANRAAVRSVGHSATQTGNLARLGRVSVDRSIPRTHARSMTIARLAGLLALCGCVAGCATPGGKVSAGVGTLAAAGAFAITLRPPCHDTGSPDMCLGGDTQVVGLAVLAGAAYLAALAFEIYGLETTPAASPASVHSMDSSPRPGAASDATITARDPRAEQLTLQAYLAARIGRCNAVVELGAQVRELDPAYRDRVFAKSPTVAAASSARSSRRGRRARRASGRRCR